MPSSKRSWLVPEYGNFNDPEVRAKYGYLEAGVSIVGNALLFVLKLFLGIFINSIALIADAFHTLSDVGTSGVVILGFRIAKKPPDAEHPFGHGRVEYIATLIVAILLFVAGIGFIEQSLERFREIEELVNADYALIIGIIIIITAVAKELMAQFSSAIGKMINSDILIADAWHHRSDSIASVAVGVSIIGSNYGYIWLDPLFGVVVSLIIIYVGYDMIKRTSNTLIGAAPDSDIIEQIKKTVKPIPEAKDIDKIYIHDYGPSKVVSLHLNVEHRLSIEEAHDIADRIEELINSELGYSTIIHLEPKEQKEDERISDVIIENILKAQKEIVSFHKINVTRRADDINIKMHIRVDESMPIADAHKLHHKLQKIIINKCGDCHLDIHLEPCGNACEACSNECDNKDASE